MDDFWRGKRVLVTGHTGFKGGWLSLSLIDFGAEVFGYSLEPLGKNNLFDQLELGVQTDHFIGDIRDAGLIRERIHAVRPNVVFHLAAQPLVLQSYRDPITTWQTNVMGTINLLEALRHYRLNCAVVVITTDKVYENREWTYAYRETDRLGGYDPYSSSKAATELAVQSWRRAFFSKGLPVRVASARSGNVIGGGDWSQDRLVPDLVRALISDKPLQVRNPGSVRPWQHVLEPIWGYLRLGQMLYEEPDSGLQDAFNFGPHTADCRTVRDLIEFALQIWPGSWLDASEAEAPHEARLLALTIEKACTMLSWAPKWRFDDAVRETLHWYRQVQDGRAAREVSLEQIRRFAAA